MEETLSTTIDTEVGPSGVGGGMPDLSEPKVPEPKENIGRLEKLPSAREDLAAVLKDEAKKADEKNLDLAKDDAKPAKAEDAKAPKADEAKTDEGKADEDDRKAETKDAEAKESEPEKDAKPGERRNPEAPTRFLPKAKEVWRNTPHDVKLEVERMAREHDEEVKRHSERSQRYEEVREFDDIARANGRSLRDSLAKVVEIETILQRNPLQGIQQLLIEAGPRKADGTPLSLMEVAQHIVRMGPDGYSQAMRQQPQQQQQPQSDPRVSQLEQQIASMRQEQITQQIIAPFRAQHPRYDELQADIAFFLTSDKIPTSLSAPERLAAAYDMAERINPSSNVHSIREAEASPDPVRRADDDFGGSKSIKSAPGFVSDDAETEAKSGESIRDSLLKEMRRMNR